MFRTGLETTNLFNHTDDPCKTVDSVMKHVSPPVTDGEWVAFASTRDVNSEIYKVDKNGKNLIRLTDDPAADYTPAWSPDGSRIAFVSRRDGFTNLYFMDADGKNVIQLTKHMSTIELPSWSPDSKMIAFAADFETSRDIYNQGMEPDDR